MQNDIVKPTTSPEPQPAQDPVQAQPTQNPVQTKQPPQSLDVVAKPPQQQSQTQNTDVMPNPDQAEKKVDQMLSLERETAQPQTQALEESNKSSKKPLGAIFAAILICLLFVGGTVYLGMLDSKKDGTPATTENAQQSTQTTQPSAAEDNQALVDEANKLTAPEQDLDAELSDQSLGL